LRELDVFLSFYGFYKKGFLPESGGILNQSNIFIESCSFLDTEIAKLENKKLRELKSDGKKRA